MSLCKHTMCMQILTGTRRGHWIYWELELLVVISDPGRRLGTSSGLLEEQSSFLKHELSPQLLLHVCLFVLTEYTKPFFKILFSFSERNTDLSFLVISFFLVGFWIMLTLKNCEMFSLLFFLEDYMTSEHLFILFFCYNIPVKWRVSFPL